MRALIWSGVTLIVVGVLLYVAFRLAIWFAAAFLVLGLAAIVWGAFKTRKVLR